MWGRNGQKQARSVPQRYTATSRREVPSRGFASAGRYDAACEADPAVSAPSSVLLLPGALAESSWLGPDALREMASSPAWRALTTRIRDTRTWASADALPEPGHECWLRERLGLTDDESFAACSLTRSDDAARVWRLDPVHLHLGRDHLVLTDPGVLAVDPTAWRALAEAAHPLFAEEGLALDADLRPPWRLIEIDPDRPLRLRTRSMAGTLGRSIDARLPLGPDARRWRRLLNEIQMTWHAHPINEGFEERGLPTVNGLWIEGPSPAPSRWRDERQRQAAACLARALTAGSRAPQDSPPAQAASHIVRAEDAQGVVCLDDRLLRAQFGGDPLLFLAAWRELTETTLAQALAGEPPWHVEWQLVLTGDAGWRSLGIAPRPVSLGHRILRRLTRGGGSTVAQPERWLTPPVSGLDAT